MNPVETNNPFPLRAALAGTLSLIQLALALPLILSGQMIGRAGFDQINFHERAVRIFAADLPRLDLENYLSATTPGYHIFLAVFVRAFGDSPAFIQIVAHSFSAALLALLVWYASRRANPVLVFVAGLAFVLSKYTFFPAVWILPDNAGWLAVLAVLIMALEGRHRARSVAIASMTLAALVLVRQVHIWTLAPLAVGLLWPRTDDPLEIEERASPAREPATEPALLGRVLSLVAAAAPAVVILLYFVNKWSGLTPPLFQSQYSPPPQAPKLNLAAPVFTLAIIGLYAPFFAVSWLPRVLHIARKHAAALAVGLVLAFVGMLIPSTTAQEDPNLGRWGGLWSVAARFPSLAGHSSVFLCALAGIGLIALVGLLSRQRPREAMILIVTIAAFSATQAVAYQLWQRYAEPLVLMLYVLMITRTAPGVDPLGDPRRNAPGLRRLIRFSPTVEAVGPALLSLALAAMTAQEIRRGEPQPTLTAEQLMSDAFPRAPRNLTPRIAP